MAAGVSMGVASKVLNSTAGNIRISEGAATRVREAGLVGTPSSPGSGSGTANGFQIGPEATRLPWEEASGISIGV
ncbi:MAG: hypothetical protein WCS65_14495 [Verrucomicrobiae bacterium]